MIDANTIIDYGYDDFCSGIDHIARSIKSSGWSPDYIVGIVRGGSVPAVYLSHKLKVPVQMIHWNTRDNGTGNEHNCWIPEDINAGKQVLLIDDIVDGGETIQELLADWNGAVPDPLNGDNLRIAALIYNTSQSVTVDFYHQTVDREEDQRWYHFPWEA